MTQPVTLWYWVHSTVLKVDSIQTSLDITVGDLEGRIREAASQLYGTPIRDVDLYSDPQARVNLARNYKDDLGQLSISQLDGPLPPVATLAETFAPNPKKDHLHLVVVVPQGTLDVRCWLRGFTPMDDFSARTLITSTVRDLRDAIKAANVEDFGDVPSHRLRLYKVTQYEEAELEVNLRTLGSGRLLKENELMVNVIHDVPFCQSPHIVVEVSRGPKGYKHLPDWDVAERASKKPKVTPSNFGASEYYDCQVDVETRILDHRFPDKMEDQLAIGFPDMKLPPFAVLYSGFGEFLDTFRAEIRGQGKAFRGSGALRESVEIFAEHMARVHKSEKSRQIDGLKDLNRVFFHNFSHPVIVPTSIDVAISDGQYVYGPYEIPCFFVEFKKEDAGSKAIPAMQLASYYQRSIKRVDKVCKEVIYSSRLPALGMTIVGPVVTFYALAWVGSVVIDPLTSGISCISSAVGGDDRHALHGAFVAAIELLAQIEDNAKKLSIPLPGPRLVHHFFPDITELPYFSFGTQDSIKFQIIDVIQGRPDRILYRAKSVSPEVDSQLVIKITRSYSTELHHFCASRGHAPMIRGFKKFPGDIFVVAMEYLEGDHLGLEGPQELRDKLAGQLKRLVEAFHLADFVHGDLRLPNIYCVGDKVMLLDFDWGGTISAAHYPRQTLNPVLSKGRDMDDLRITKEDDERVLKMTLESVRCT